MFHTKPLFRTAFVAPALALAAQAHAEVPAGVTSALADMKTDGLSVAAVVLIATVAIFAFKMIRKGL